MVAKKTITFIFERYTIAPVSCKLVIYPLIIKVPTETKAEAGGVHGVAGTPKVSACALIGVMILDIEAGALEVKIGIGGNDGIVADFHYLVGILIHEHSEHRRIVGCIIFGKIYQVATQFCL